MLYLLLYLQHICPRSSLSATANDLVFPVRIPLPRRILSREERRSLFRDYSRRSFQSEDDSTSFEAFSVAGGGSNTTSSVIIPCPCRSLGILASRTHSYRPFIAWNLIGESNEELKLSHVSIFYLISVF